MILKNIIEHGVLKLEKISDVLWSTHHNSKMNRETFIKVMIEAIDKDKQAYECSPYTSKSGFSTAMGRIVSNVPNMGTGIRWKKFILNLAEHEQCYKCKEVKSFDMFYNSKRHSSGKDTLCIDCHKRYKMENSTQIKKTNKIYKKEHSKQISEYNKEYREENREKLIQGKNTSLIYILDIAKEYDMLPECSICSYNNNWAAIDIHHIDSTLDKPEYAYNRKTGEVYTPSLYIFNSINKEVAKERFLKEIDNFMFLCRNCHTKEHSIGLIDRQKGLKEALEYLGFIYECSNSFCNENLYLELHHNNPKEKECSFLNFSDLSKKRILFDGLLAREMKKDVKILCGNHHREIHNPRMILPELLT